MVASAIFPLTSIIAEYSMLDVIIFRNSEGGFSLSKEFDEYDAYMRAKFHDDYGEYMRCTYGDYDTWQRSPSNPANDHPLRDIAHDIKCATKDSLDNIGYAIRSAAKGVHSCIRRGFNRLNPEQTLHR